MEGNFFSSPVRTLNVFFYLPLTPLSVPCIRMKFDWFGAHVISHIWRTKLVKHDGHLCRKFAANFIFVLIIWICVCVYGNERRKKKINKWMKWVRICVGTNGNGVIVDPKNDQHCIVYIFKWDSDARCEKKNDWCCYSPIEDLWPECMQTRQNIAVATKLNANKSI